MTWLEVAPPGSDEFDSFYQGYIENVGSPRLSLILRQQLAAVLELIGGLDDEQAGYRYAPGKWSIKQLLGHLIDTERVFAFRAMSIARGERQPLPGFDQDSYVAEGHFDRRTVASLVEDYRALRKATIAFFESLDEAAWLRTGTANGVTLSVRAIAYIIPGHEAHHLAILRERYLSER